MALTGGDPEILSAFTSRMQAINQVTQSRLTSREAEFKLSELSNAIVVAEHGSEEFNELVNECRVPAYQSLSERYIRQS